MLMLSSLLTSVCYPYTLSYAGFQSEIGVQVMDVDDKDAIRSTLSTSIFINEVTFLLNTSVGSFISIGFDSHVHRLLQTNTGCISIIVLESIFTAIVVIISIVEDDVSTITFTFNLITVAFLGILHGMVSTKFTTQWMPDIRQVTLIDQTYAFYQRSFFESIGFVIGAGIQLLLVQQILQERWYGM